MFRNQFPLFVCALTIIVSGLNAGCKVDAAVSGERDHRAETDAPLAGFTFLTGTWESMSPDENDELLAASVPITEEQWTHPRAGTMFATNRVMKDGSTVFFEFLRIEHDPGTGDITYYAAPQGRHPATPFVYVPDESIAHRRVVFQNPEHDFPNRIIYELDDSSHSAQLIMRIEDMPGDDQRASEWRMQRTSR